VELLDELIYCLPVISFLGILAGGAFRASRTRMLRGRDKVDLG